MLALQKISIVKKIENLLTDGAGSASNTPQFIVNNIKTNIRWFNKYEAPICNFFKGHK